MKNIQSLRLVFSGIIATSLVSLLITACQKDTATHLEQAVNAPQDQFSGQYSKQIVLSDGAILLEISTDHAEMLNWFKVSDLNCTALPAALTEPVAEEVELGNADNKVEASELTVPAHLVVVKVKKADGEDQAIVFSSSLQDKLNAVGATIRFVTEAEAVSDRATINGSPKRIWLGKHQPSKPAFVYVRWRCANTNYLTTHNWGANTGTYALYRVCPVCSSATRYFFNYDYYCASNYSTVFLALQSTACN